MRASAGPAAMAAIAGLCAALLPAQSCSSPPAPTELGLEAVRISLPSESYAQLLHGGRRKNAVGATVELGGNSYETSISLSGAGSLTHHKKSFDIESPDGVHAAFKLSAQSQDPSFLRTLVGRRVLDALGLLVPEVEPVAVYMNSEYLGLFLRIEKVDERFYERRGTPSRRIYKALPNRATFTPQMARDPEYGLDAKQGEFERSEISRLAVLVNSPEAGNSPLGELGAAVDLDSAVALLAGNVFLWNCDGIGNNFYLFRPASGAPLVFSPWDWERSWEASCDDRFLLESNRLFRLLASHPELRRRLKERLRELVEDRFPLSALAELADSEAGRIAEAYRADPWLGGLGRDPGSAREAFKVEIARALERVSAILAEP